MHQNRGNLPGRRVDEMEVVAFRGVAEKRNELTCCQLQLGPNGCRPLWDSVPFGSSAPVFPCKNSCWPEWQCMWLWLQRKVSLIKCTAFAGGLLGFSAQSGASEPGSVASRAQWLIQTRLFACRGLSWPVLCTRVAFRSLQASSHFSLVEEEVICNSPALCRWGAAVACMVERAAVWRGFGRVCVPSPSSLNPLSLVGPGWQRYQLERACEQTAQEPCVLRTGGGSKLAQAGNCTSMAPGAVGPGLAVSGTAVLLGLG